MAMPGLRAPQPPDLLAACRILDLDISGKWQKVNGERFDTGDEYRFLRVLILRHAQHRRAGIASGIALNGPGLREPQPHGLITTCRFLNEDLRIRGFSG
jgi:hypothetical protein